MEHRKWIFCGQNFLHISFSKSEPSDDEDRTIHMESSLLKSNLPSSKYGPSDFHPTVLTYWMQGILTAVNLGHGTEWIK